MCKRTEFLFLNDLRYRRTVIIMITFVVVIISIICLSSWDTYWMQCVCQDLHKSKPFRRSWQIAERLHWVQGLWRYHFFLWNI